jgi:hypothetical protein
MNPILLRWLPITSTWLFILFIHFDSSIQILNFFRKKRFPAIPIKDLDFPLVEDFFKEIYGFKMEKRTKVEVEMVQKKQIIDSSVKHPLKDIQCLVGQFFRFISLLEPVEETGWSAVYLLDDKRYRSYVSFLNGMEYAPNSVANKVKALTQVRKHSISLVLLIEINSLLVAELHENQNRV